MGTSYDEWWSEEERLDLLLADMIDAHFARLYEEAWDMSNPEELEEDKNLTQLEKRCDQQAAMDEQLVKKAMSRTRFGRRMQQR